jgi:hypothetical protein
MEIRGGTPGTQIGGHGHALDCEEALMKVVKVLCVFEISRLDGNTKRQIDLVAIHVDDSSWRKYH